MFYKQLKKNVLKNERIAYFLFFGERCERFAHGRSFPLSEMRELLRSLTKNEQCERITQVAHQKMSDHE